MQHHTFEVREGQTVEDGKPTWSHHIRMVMCRADAYEIIRSLIVQLADDDTEWMQVYLPGLLKTEADAE